MQGSSLGQRPGPPWTGHVDRLFPEFDELFAAAEAVEQLTATPGWEHLMRLLDAEAGEVMAAADSRLLGSRSEYAFAHGRAGGLRGVRLAAGAILARAATRLEQQRVKHEGAAESVPGGRT
jgi:hypothetical protein